MSVVAVPLLPSAIFMVAAGVEPALETSQGVVGRANMP